MSKPSADLRSLSRNENIVACYRPPPGTTDRDLAHEAYAKAVEYFTKEFAENEDVRGFLTGQTTIREVENTVEQAKREYEAKGQKRRKASEWLSKLSLGIRYYSQALDMLAQHHPEYVALAWGAIKFVLIGVINHEELIEKLAKALTLIGNVLPNVKLSAQLYQTEQMKDAIASLYAHIIRFFQQAAAWYNKSSAGRALSSILKPFVLDYQDTVDQIKLCSETINNIAHSASRAEIRDMHITLQIIHRNQQGMRQELRQELQQGLHNIQEQSDEREVRVGSQINQVLQVAIASKTINEAVQLDVRDIKPRVHDLQFANIFKILSPLSPEVSPENILRMHTSQAIGRRRHQASTGYRQTSADMSKALDLWVSTTGSSLFILRSGPRANSITRDHVVDIINYLRSAKYRVFWILSPPKRCDIDGSVASILQSLVYQVIHHEPDLLMRFPENLSSLQFLPNRNESEWLDFLCLLVSRLDKCFIIVETEDLYQSSRQVPEWTQEFLQVFQRLINRVEVAGSLVKVLVVTFSREANLVPSQPGAVQFVATVQQPRVVPPRLRRGLSRSKLRRYSQQSSKLQS